MMTDDVGIAGVVVKMSRFSWHAVGSNSSGALGVGDSADRYTLVPCLSAASRAVCVVAGGRHSIFLRGPCDASVSCILCDGGGACDGAAPLIAGTWRGGDGGGERATDDGYGGGGSARGIPKVSAALARVRITTAAAGWEHALLVDAGGGIWALGAGRYGRLGLGGSGDVATPTRLELPDGARADAVAAGGAHSLAVDAEGRLWAGGRGQGGGGAMP